MSIFLEFIYLLCIIRCKKVWFYSRLRFYRAVGRVLRFWDLEFVSNIFVVRADEFFLELVI